MHKKRIQLTLFIDEKEAEAIEKIRKEFNPKQYELIKSHVTLCREDELDQIEKVILNAEKLNLDGIIINFGEPVRFLNGKGVLIMAAGNNKPFQELRKKILHGTTLSVTTHQPHITLMHPRNSTCTDAIFKQIAAHHFPHKIKFSKITLIEQEAGMKWNILKEFDLRYEKGN